MLRTIRLRLGRASHTSTRKTAACFTTSAPVIYRDRPTGTGSDTSDRRSYGLNHGTNADAGPSRSHTDRGRGGSEPYRKRTEDGVKVPLTSRFRYNPDGRLTPRTPPAFQHTTQHPGTSAFDALDLGTFTSADPIDAEIIEEQPNYASATSSAPSSQAAEHNNTSTETAQATLTKSFEEDEFFGGYIDPTPPTVPSPASSAPSSSSVPSSSSAITTSVTKPISQAPSTAPAPLASYTPPTHSGVAQIKSFLLEYKFLSTQEIYQMGTGHLRAPITPSHVIEPDGRIKMKRVATMREGRRTWIPPATPSFPQHPFRSVRFLKETLLASLENAGLIHKRCLARPLETEEEHEAAIKNAESSNRKMERRAALKGLPTPPVKAPATSLPIWGWMLGPRPELIVHPEDAEYARRLENGGAEEADLSNDEKERRVLRGEAVYREGEISLETGRQDAQAQQMEYEASGRRSDPSGEVFGRQMDAESERRSWGQRGAPPARTVAQEPYNARATLDQGQRELGGFGNEKSAPAQRMRKVRMLFPPPYSIEDARAMDDYDVSHLQWRWAEGAEFEYHKAKLAEAEAAAERQQVRRARNREASELRRIDQEKIEQEGLGEEVMKEMRRLEAIEHVLDYARLTGNDVSGWIGEMQGRLGEYVPYEPKFEHRGGAVPRKKGPRAGWKTHSFPIN